MRSPQQVRAETCFHEAGHIVAAHLLGRGIEHASVWSEHRLAGLPKVIEEGDPDGIGQVVYSPAAVTTIGEAVDDITCSLAGDVGARLAWTAGLVTDEQFGYGEVPDSELSPDEIPIVRSTPAAKAGALAIWFMPGRGDLAHAQEVAAEFTGSQQEAALLVAFCTARAGGLIQSERGQRILSVVALALEAHGQMDRELVAQFLDRASVLID